jgi:hypothetical protein
MPLAAAAQNAGWLLLNSEAQDAVMVSDPAEKDRLAKGPWKIEGEFRFLAAAEPGAAALHRMARPNDKGADRLLTTKPEDVVAAVKAGYADEGVVGYVAPTQLSAGLVPVYRYRKDSRSLWLVNPDDRPWAEKAGWVLDGPTFWVSPAPVH